MLILESQMGYANSGVNLGLQLLNEMYFLDKTQSAYVPALVPVMENSNLGRIIIRLEDLQEFCEANRIFDMGYAIQTICEANRIDPSYVGFSIASSTVLSDPDLANLSAELLNEGVCVVATPVNENDAACLAIDMAMYQLLETGYDTMLEAIAYDDYYTFFSEADDQSNKKPVETLPMPYRLGAGGIDVSDNAYRTLANTRSAIARSSYEANADARKGGQVRVLGKDGTFEVQERTKMGTLNKIWDKIKSGANISRDWIAKQLDKLNAWMRSIIDKESTAKEGSKEQGFFSKVKEKIARVIEILTRKLHDTIQSKRGKISDMDKIAGTEKKWGWSDNRPLPSANNQQNQGSNNNANS